MIMNIKLILLSLFKRLHRNVLKLFHRNRKLEVSIENIRKILKVKIVKLVDESNQKLQEAK